MGLGANIFASADISGAPSSSADSGPAVYGPTASGGTHPLHPKTGFGLGFWGGVGAVVLLVLIRQSLPR